MEARAKIPKTLEPLTVSEHALSRKSTAAISLSILKPLDVRNTKIYPKRELVGHTSSCKCSMPNSPAWEFEEFFKSKLRQTCEELHVWGLTRISVEKNLFKNYIYLRIVVSIRP